VCAIDLQSGSGIIPPRSKVLRGSISLNDAIIGLIAELTGVHDCDILLDEYNDIMGRVVGCLLCKAELIALRSRTLEEAGDTRRLQFIDVAEGPVVATGLSVERSLNLGHITEIYCQINHVAVWMAVANVLFFVCVDKPLLVVWVGRLGRHRPQQGQRYNHQLFHLIIITNKYDNPYSILYIENYI
jgi:hypothetical protein